MAYFKFLINGIEYPFSSLRYERSYSLTAQPFTVILPVIENIVSLANVQIKRDGTSVYDGKIYDIEKTISAKKGKQFILSGFDLKHKLPFLPSVGEEFGELWGRPSGTELTSHLRDQLTSSDLSEGTFDNTTKTYAVIFGTPDAKFDRRQAIQAICEITGWEFFSQPDGTCDFQSQIQTDRTSTIRFKRGDLLEEWVEPFGLKASHKVEKITVTGHNIGDLMAKGSAELGGYVAGDREKTISFRHVKTDAAADDAAAALLADWQNDVYYGTFTATDTFDGHAYDVGDLIHVEDDEFDVDGDYRVASIKKSVGKGESESTKIEITNISKLNLNAPYLLRGGEKKLIDAFMGVDALGKIHHFPDTRTLTRWLVETSVFNDPFWEINTNIWTKNGFEYTITATPESGLTSANFHLNANALAEAELTSVGTYFGNTKWRLAFKLKCSDYDNSRFECGAKTENGGIYGIFFYFNYASGNLEAITWNGVGNQTATIIEDWTAEILEYHEYMVERLSSSDARFYVDGVQRGKNTTDVPSSALNFHIGYYNADATARDMYVRTCNAQELK